MFLPVVFHSHPAAAHPVMPISFRLLSLTDVYPIRSGLNEILYSVAVYTRRAGHPSSSKSLHRQAVRPLDDVYLLFYSSSLQRRATAVRRRHLTAFLLLLLTLQLPLGSDRGNQPGHTRHECHIIASETSSTTPLVQIACSTTRQRKQDTKRNAVYKIIYHDYMMNE